MIELRNVQKSNLLGHKIGGNQFDNCIEWHNTCEENDFSIKNYQIKQKVAKTLVSSQLRPAW